MDTSSPLPDQNKISPPTVNTNPPSANQTQTSPPTNNNATGNIDQSSAPQSVNQPDTTPYPNSAPTPAVVLSQSAVIGQPVTYTDNHSSVRDKPLMKISLL